MENEIFNEFLIRIKTDVKSCHFGNLQESLLKDKIIYGRKSNVVRERLLITENLNLNKAISICCLNEQTSKHIKEIEYGINALSRHANAPSNSERDVFQCRLCGTKLSC